MFPQFFVLLSKIFILFCWWGIELFFRQSIILLMWFAFADIQKEKTRDEKLTTTNLKCKWTPGGFYDGIAFDGAFRFIAIMSIVADVLRLGF